MKNILLLTLVISTQSFAQNVGVGTTLPTAKLHVSSLVGEVAKFNGPTGMYLSFFESGVYRGYIGSYSGNDADIDVGTGGSNTTGNLNLCIQALPRVTINNLGKVGIGTTTPHTDALLHVQSSTLKGSYFTNTSGLANSAVLKLQSLTTSPEHLSIGLEVDQHVTDGRGIGVNSQAGYIGGRFSSSDANFAMQNYGIMGNTNSDADAWGVHGTAGTGAITGGVHIGVYGRGYGGTTNWAFWGQGNAFLSGGTWQTSDEKLKSNISSLKDAGAKLKMLSAKTYHFKTKEFDYLSLPEEEQLGFLASELEQVFPYLVKNVSAYKAETIEPRRNPEKLYFKSVNYTGLIPVLVAAFNEQAGEMEILKIENAKMQTELILLAERVKKLENKKHSLGQ